MNTVNIDLPLSLNMFHFADVSKTETLSGISSFCDSIYLKLKLTNSHSAVFHMDN